MEQKEFKFRLNESTKDLIEFAQTYVKNSISKNVEYELNPNSRDISEHLNEQELNKLKELNNAEGKVFNSDEVVSILYDSGLVPLWINMKIDRSTKRKTLIKLICSRRFRSDQDLNHIANKFPPFNFGVPLPFWRKENKKFDINWKHQKLKIKWHRFIWKYYKRYRK